VLSPCALNNFTRDGQKKCGKENGAIQIIRDTPSGSTKRLKSSFKLGFLSFGCKKVMFGSFHFKAQKVLKTIIIV